MHKKTIIMKKVFTFALLALSMAAMAQHVTPIEVRVTDLKLDSLRAQYVSEPAIYRSKLEILARELEQDAKALKQARVELKAEQAHAKEKTATINQSFKLAGVLRKTFEQEESELIDMQKMLEKQLINLSKQTLLNQETRDSYTTLLAENQQKLNYELRDVADRKRAITDMEEDLRAAMNTTQAYSQEVMQKAADIAHKEAHLKLLQATLKKEQKAAKSMQ